METKFCSWQKDLVSWICHFSLNWHKHSGHFQPKSSKCACMHIHVCVLYMCVFVFIHICIQAHVDTKARGQCWVRSLGPVWHSPNSQAGWLATGLQRSSCLCLLGSAIICIHFSPPGWGLELRYSCLCRNTLPTKQSRQLRNILWFYFKRT